MARRADIVLPVATTLERDDIARGHGDHVLAPNRRAVGPAARGPDRPRGASSTSPRARDRGVAFTEGRSTPAWLAHLYEATRCGSRGPRRRPATVRRRSGPLRAGRGRRACPARRPPYERLREDPARAPAVDPVGTHRDPSPRPSPAFGYDDCPAHPAWLEPAEWLGAPAAARHPLHLCSNQPATPPAQPVRPRRGEPGRARWPGREPIRINPATRRDRGIADGDLVRVFNDRGACLAGAVVTDAVMPRRRVAVDRRLVRPARPGRDGSLDVHGNPNVLTLDIGTSRLAQGPSSQHDAGRGRAVPRPAPGGEGLRPAREPPGRAGRPPQAQGMRAATASRSAPAMASC